MIYYIVPSSDKPSWGLAIIYNHVSMLVRNGLKACIVKEGLQCAPSWMDIIVPFYTVGNFKKDVQENDTIVVPEVMVDFYGLKKLKGRKILFLQAGGLLFQSMPFGETHISLGFDHVWIILPHMKSIVERHVSLPYSIIPPFVAPYFYKENLDVKRKKQVLMFPKFQQIDYSIVNHIVKQYIQKAKKAFFRNLLKDNNWHIIEMKDLSHHQVAAEMKQSVFFVSLNVFEALNTSVVEAMAAGCVVFCYEGFGPRDYLVDKENAMVFSNNEPYILAEKICEWMDHYDERLEELSLVRKQASETAARYTEHTTRIALLNFFEG